MSKTIVRTEADALREIVSWSKTRPVWQQDALQRIIENGDLTDSDIMELTEICKDPSRTSNVLGGEHILAQKIGAPEVTLGKISRVQNINALAENQSLTFIRNGITIIYGDNGSGKSGFVRILKQLCWVRNDKGKEELLPNVYKEFTKSQCANIEYFAASEGPLNIMWQKDQPVCDSISDISIFDTRSANIHVEGINRLSYTPFPMKILERLAIVSNKIKQIIEEDIKRLKEQTPSSISNPSCSPQTVVGKLIRAISKDTKPEDVSQLAQLSDHESTRLATLASDFNSDPKETERKLRRQKIGIENILSDLENLNEAVSPSSTEKLANLTSVLKAKKIAAEIALNKNFKDEPLEGIGSKSWRILWEAARAYSIGEAYPEKSFPATDEKDICVLCLQELGGEAGVRLQRFEAFVQDRTQQEKDAAERELSEFLGTLHSAKVSYEKRSENRQFLAYDIGNIRLANAYRAFIVKALWRLRGMLRMQDDIMLELPTLADIGLKSEIDSLDVRAGSLMAGDRSEECRLLEKEIDEIKDKKWLIEMKDDVLAEIDRLKKIHVLNEAKKDVDSRAITAKNTEMSKVLITERLRKAFADEIKSLGLEHLDVELKQENSQRGASRFQIRLSQSVSEKVGSILSEGEHRCVAIAGFLAEIATNDKKSGVVFDDPVSSLDHIHRESVAKRLAKEGLERQVIVFTHDLSFLSLLKNACSRNDDTKPRTELAVRHIQKKANIPGYCSTRSPEKTKQARDRIDSIRKCLEQEKYKYSKDPDGTEWLITSRGLIDSLRQSWESAIEEIISPVLCRFSNNINTTGFISLSVIKEEDGRKMRKHYKICSGFLHDSSSRLNPKGPTPSQIECELNALDDWIQDIQNRQKSKKFS